MVYLQLLIRYQKLQKKASEDKVVGSQPTSVAAKYVILEEMDEEDSQRELSNHII